MLQKLPGIYKVITSLTCSPFATGRWFCPTQKNYSHDITEILLKVTLNTLYVCRVKSEEKLLFTTSNRIGQKRSSTVFIISFNIHDMRSLHVTCNVVSSHLSWWVISVQDSKDVIKHWHWQTSCYTFICVWVFSQ